MEWLNTGRHFLYMANQIKFLFCTLMLLQLDNLQVIYKSKYIQHILRLRVDIVVFG